FSRIFLRRKRTNFRQLKVLPIRDNHMSRETKQIFVIEDNEADASLMEEALATAGLQYEVTRFRDGTEAMRFLLAQGTLVPDAILLDLEMPQSEGLDILRRIRATPKLSEIPVGIVT